MGLNRISRSVVLGELLSFLALLVSCGDAPVYDADISVPFDSAVIAQDASVEGFVKVLATGARVELGDSDPSANVKERSQLKVAFDYDFSIGVNEVTCGEYDEVARRAKLELFPMGIHESKRYA